jgi:carboxypeptidase C (cathepsin A)
VSKTVVAGFLLLAVGLSAQRQPAPEGQKPPEAREAQKPEPLKEKTAVTQHTIRLGGQELKYTATAGTILLKKDDGTPRASVFFVAYTKDGVADLSKRPITYAFNGGPGSSSVWLHLGCLGPKRVLLDDQGNPPPPPYRLVDNEESILDRTDLVFIDPVTTGFSRAAQEKDAKDFHGFREDIASVGEFIRMYTTRNGRWASPKYLAGESYGTTRAAGLSGYLQDSLGMNLNGVILISSVLNFQTLAFDTGNDLPYILYLPTYTATAWYHKRLAKDLQVDLKKTLAESEQFAAGEYTQALMKGDRLTDEERGSVVKKLARYTGLSPKYVEETNLRIRISRFCKELLRDKRRTVGRYDSRYEGMDSDAAGERAEYDPSYAVAQGPYTATFNQYIRQDLKFDTDVPYQILTGGVRPWNWAPFENRYVNVAETLREAITQNPNLRVYVAKGYYDLATPFFAADYVMDHMGLESPLRSNITGDYFEAGHMLYLHKPSLEKLKSDLAEFIR